MFNISEMKSFHIQSWFMLLVAYMHLTQSIYLNHVSNIIRYCLSSLIYMCHQVGNLKISQNNNKKHWMKGVLEPNVLHPVYTTRADGLGIDLGLNCINKK